MSNVNFNIDDPIEPAMDMWFMCPRCGHEQDFPDDSTNEVAVQGDGSWLWVGPTRCEVCGQSINLYGLNIKE